jgi:hypothetical protein
MELQQLNIDFTHPHNNVPSAVAFEKNKEHYNNQCGIVLRAMQRGERLTTTTALINYGIGDLRRRVKDLKDIYHIEVKSAYAQGTRFKEYFL